MVRKLLLVLLIGIFFISGVYAIDSDLNSEYAPRETAIVKLTGNIAGTIDENQVYIKRANIFVPVEYGVDRIGKNWYVWFVNPEQQGNYTIYIDDVETLNSMGNPSLEDYRKDFKVEGVAIDYNVKPGFLKTSQDFSLRVSVFDGEDKSIETGFSSQIINTEINPGLNDIDFSVSSIKNSGVNYLKVGNYNVPVYVTVPGTVEIDEGLNTNSNNSSVNGTEITNQTNQTVESKINIEIYPSFVERVLYSGADQTKYSFTIVNPNNERYQDIELKYNKSLFEIYPEEIVLEKNSSFTFNVTVAKFDGDEIKETIYINGTEFYFEVPISFVYVENVSDVVEFYGGKIGNVSNSTNKVSAMCGELGGYICGADTKCSGQIIESVEGNCCWNGKCIPIEKEKNSAWIGWIIGLVVLVGLWWLYYKYSGAGKVSGSPVSRMSMPQGP